MATSRPRHIFTENDEFAALYHRVRPLYRPASSDSEVVRDLAVKGARSVLEARSTLTDEARLSARREALADLRARFDLAAIRGPSKAAESFGSDDWDED